MSKKTIKVFGVAIAIQIALGSLTGIAIGIVVVLYKLFTGGVP